MLIRVATAGLAATVVMFVWGFVFWVVLFPPGTVLKTLPDEALWMQRFSQDLPQSGSYYFPLAPGKAGEGNDGSGLSRFRERRIAGPVGLLHFKRTGSDPYSPLLYLMGFGQLYLSSLIAGMLLVFALPRLDSLGSRAVFVFWLGVFAAVTTRISDPIWWSLPWGLHLAGALYLAVNWLLAGLVLGFFIRPPRGYTHITDSGKPLWKRALDVD